MKSAFNKNVPKKKPRTRLGTMLAELPAPEVDSDLPAPAAEAPAPEPEAIAAPEPVLEPEPVVEPEPPKPKAKPKAKAKKAEPAPPKKRPLMEPPAAEVVKSGRDRIDELKKRLAVASRRNAEPAPAPAATASRVRETVASLRAELERVQSEKRALADTLEDRDQRITHLEADLDTERKAKTAAESLAGERQEVADALIEESEALAEERDRALARIGELTELDKTQRELVVAIEAELEKKDEALATARESATELNDALAATTAELQLVEGRLADETAARASLAARVAELEADLLRAQSAKEALSEIQRLVDGV